MAKERKRTGSWEGWIDEECPHCHEHVTGDVVWHRMNNGEVWWVCPFCEDGVLETGEVGL